MDALGWAGMGWGEAASHHPKNEIVRPITINRFCVQLHFWKVVAKPGSKGLDADDTRLLRCNAEPT